MTLSVTVPRDVHGPGGPRARTWVARALAVAGGLCCCAAYALAPSAPPGVALAVQKPAALRPVTRGLRGPAPTKAAIPSPIFPQSARAAARTAGASEPAPPRPRPPAHAPAPGLVSLGLLVPFIVSLFLALRRGSRPQAPPPCAMAAYGAVPAPRAAPPAGRSACGAGPLPVEGRRSLALRVSPEDEAEQKAELGLLTAEDGAAVVEGGGGAGEETAAERVERAMLYAVAASGAFMFVWVFTLFPGSAYTGFRAHDALIDWAFDRIPLFGIVAPASLITKYNELGHLPALTHAVPGAVWAALAPLQLLPDARARLGPRGHAAAGRVMLSAAAVLMCGYFIIDANGLYSDVHDFAGNGGGLAAAVDGARVLPLPFNTIGVRLIAGYFIASGVATFAFAKRRDYPRHRRWAVRHVGAGLWVALQRPVYAAVRLAQAAALGTAASVTPGAEADAFYYAAYATTFAYMTAAEWLARRPAAGAGLRRTAADAAEPPQ